MEWELCSSPFWVPFYPYTMFQNPVSKPSCQKSRQTIITQKVFVTQSFQHSTLQSAYPKSYRCRFPSLFKQFFPVQIDFFLIFCQEELSKQPKNSHFVDFDCKNASQWLEWHLIWVQGVPNPMAQVLGIYDKCFLKNQNFRQKFNIFVDFDCKKCIKMASVVDT